MGIEFSLWAGSLLDQDQMQKVRFRGAEPFSSQGGSVLDQIHKREE